jgi:4-hydroxyphenylpyruvate dioxygenase
MLFTAPYNISSSSATSSATSSSSSSSLPLPGFDCLKASDFFIKHGLGVKAVCIEVNDVYQAYETIISNKGTSVLPPQRVNDNDIAKGYIDIAEVSLYGDVVLRLINSAGFKGKFLPNFNDINNPLDNSYGLTRFDHIVGNLWALQPKMASLKEITGFHEFAEFVAEDVGTVDSGLNSVVLANKDESVLLPLNEPTFGTKRKSQIQTYLEQNNGEGVQHMALFTPNIFDTLKKMKAATRWGGFEFMDPQPKSYYQKIRNRIGNSLTDSQYEMIEELGLLADKDDKEGVLLQIFTKPIGDRPTLFLEIIQRIGCLNQEGNQKPGCGGFGKGNFRDLFKSIEDYEKTLNI